MGEDVDIQDLDLEEVEIPEAEPELTPEPVKSVKQKPAPTGSSDKTNWKAKYDGLQGYAKQQRTDAEKFKMLYSDAVAAQESEVAEKNARIEELEKRVAELEANNTALSSERDKLHKGREVSKKIRQDHPDLLELYEDGLLRVDDMEGEELDGYLQNLASKLAGKVGTALRDTLRGAAPPRPSGSKASKTSAEIAEELFNLAPGSENYEQLYAAYDAALKAEDAG
jgi:hypothetical protein